MQIVIDIPKPVYNYIVLIGSMNTLDTQLIANAILDGAPLPKEHGRLIDANSIYQIVRPIEEIDVGWGMTGETAIRLIHEAFNRAPTIIEADKAESEE